MDITKGFSPTRQYTSLTPREVHELMATGCDCTLLDVRTPDEYEQYHIAGSVSLPDYELIAGNIPLKKTSPVVVYCQSGARSYTACLRLLRLGFCKVYDMGAITRWPYGFE